MGFRKNRISNESIEEFGDGFHLSVLCGSELTSVSDCGGILSFSGDSCPTLKITSFQSRLELEGEEISEGIESLLGSRVTGADAFSDGSLELVFEGGARLQVPIEGRQEAWELRAKPSLHVVSGMGGGVAIWL